MRKMIVGTLLDFAMVVHFLSDVLANHQRFISQLSFPSHRWYLGVSQSAALQLKAKLGWGSSGKFLRLHMHMILLVHCM